jgi:hypothetical protein
MHYSELGFDSYDEYLESSLWKKIRDIKYSAGDPYRCRLCHTKKVLYLHKRTYYNLTPEFFTFLLKHDRKMFNKILVYLCSRCNNLVHWYDGKRQKKKVPLDYLFLWEREQQLFYRLDFILRRLTRTTIWIIKWIGESYTTGEQKTTHRRR